MRDGLRLRSRTSWPPRLIIKSISVIAKLNSPRPDVKDSQNVARCCPEFGAEANRRTELVRTALMAREFFRRDKQYIVVDGKVVIVDEFTGRPMPQRTWREGLATRPLRRKKVWNSPIRPRRWRE